MKGVQGLHRLRNLAVKDKIEKLLKSEPVYMMPHKNALAELEARKNYFKPKIMLGSLSKPNIEFMSDLFYMTHNRKLVKKQMKEAEIAKSSSLMQKRESTRKNDKLQKKTREI